MVLNRILQAMASGEKLLAVLIDPDKFDPDTSTEFLQRIPKTTTHILVGGSTVEPGLTEKVVKSIKRETEISVVLFPGDYSQVTEAADGLLFLSLISGRNPEYLISQQIKSVPKLKESDLEIIPTGYLLIDGGKETAVQKVTNSLPLSQENLQEIVHTALAGEYSGKKLIYLEAGSGAEYPVGSRVISEVKKALSIPLIVGGGVRTQQQMEAAYSAGADMVVMGTAFEKDF